MATLILCDICERQRAIVVRRMEVQLPSGQHVLVSVQVERVTDGGDPEKIDVCAHHLIESVLQLGRSR